MGRTCQSIVPAALTNILPLIRQMRRLWFAPISAEKEHGGLGHAHELLHIIHGEDHVLTSRRTFKLKPGDTILIHAPHRDKFELARGLEVFMIIFEWPEGQAVLDVISPHAYQARSACAKNRIAESIEPILADCAGAFDRDAPLMRARLMTMLFIMLEDALNRAPKRMRSNAAAARRHSALMQHAQIYIASHYAEPLCLENIAEALQVSPCHLSHVFSSQCSLSLVKYIVSVRMKEARKLLLQGNLNVEEAARAVGYQDSRYFSRLFHKHFGVLPQDLRA